MADQEQSTAQPLSKYCIKCKKRYPGDMTECPDDGTHLQKNPDLIGTTFAKKYDILSKLGEGGMAVVYKAKHKHMQREVAIKMLKKHLISDAVAYQRFEQESQAASSLSHLNIVTVYDFGHEDGTAYFVMDCVEGQTLAQRLDKYHFVPEKEALDIFAQLCEGLSHAHKKGVVHRDLKPSNVVLMPQEDGKALVKIVDFGIAKLLPQAGKQIQQLTQAGEVFGSPLYMSPEQCLGHSPDPRSDIYSLGCLMYQVLTGALPLFGDTAFETMNQHVNTMPRPFRQANPDIEVSEQTELVVFKCLQKDPNHRYQSASAVLADLPLEGRAPLSITVRDLPAVPAKRKRIDPALLVTLPFALAGAFVFFSWEGSPTDRGTPYDKLSWNLCMGMSDYFLKANFYRQSLWFAEAAKEHAAHIDDKKEKYIGALAEEKAAYAGLGDVDKVKEIDVEVFNTSKEVAKQRYEDLMQIFTNASKSSSTISDAMKTALIRLPNLLLTANTLHAFGNYKREQTLLELALSDGVYGRALRKDDRQIAQLASQLGRCYQAQSKMDKAEQRFEQAQKIYEAVDPGSSDAIKSLLTLGIFEKDASSYKKAKLYLDQALTEAREHREKDDVEDLYQQCIAAYSDLIKQLKFSEGNESTITQQAIQFLSSHK